MNYEIVYACNEEEYKNHQSKVEKKKRVFRMIKRTSSIVIYISIFLYSIILFLTFYSLYTHVENKEIVLYVAVVAPLYVSALALKYHSEKWEKELKINPMMELSYRLIKDKILEYDNILHVFKVRNQIDPNLVDEIYLRYSPYDLEEKKHLNLHDKEIIDIKNKIIFVPYIK